MNNINPNKSIRNQIAEAPICYAEFGARVRQNLAESSHINFEVGSCNAIRPSWTFV